MTIGSGAVREPPAAGRRWAIGRAVARAPVSVRTKLLVGFVALAVLLLVVGLLGLVALRSSNARVQRLGDLQGRAASYKGLESDVTQLKGLLLERAGRTYNAGIPIGRGATIAPSTLFVLDATISQALTSFFGDATVLEDGDPAVFQRVYADYTQLSTMTHSALVRDQAGRGDRIGALVRHETAIASALVPVVHHLAQRTNEQAQALVVQNRHSYTHSRDVFIAVAGVGVVFALLLGFVLSWSLIEPLRRTETRLAQIAAGDFTRRIDVPNRDEVGSLAANVNRMNDELGRLYRELELVSSHKSDFLATMSHELRTPLNAIIGFSEVLHEQMFGELNERQLAYVEDVLAAGRHLLLLINDVLDLAKIEAGRMDLDFGPVSIADVLESGMTMHGERASRAGVALGLRVDDDIVVTADERRVRQVVFNLLSNAIKFTPADGRIDVSAARHDSTVEIAVADTGPGIAAEDRERIFEEFDQGSGVQRADGTGLGLPLSRKFVELHGGRLWVESAGAGSTFRFTLPIEQEA